MIVISSEKNYFAEKNSIIKTFNISDFIDNNYKVSNAWINIGGWQSWNPSYEVKQNTKQLSLKCHFIHQWNNYLVFPETKFKPSRNIVLGQFISYLRWENKYLFFISVGNIDSVLPPVQFIFNRKNNTVTIEIADKGKNWSKDEVQAKLEIFVSDSYFQAKNKLQEIFGSSIKSSDFYNKRFDQIQFLGEPSTGWESWYNHYANINSKLIEDDLNSLKTTENLLKILNSKSSVFQIDDGWETQLGNWEINKKKFPFGLKSLTEKIEEMNFIPGLWIAPFIIDLRSPVATSHPDWLLRDKNEHLIPAGFNPLWGVNGTFYALDLSNDEVLDYLDSIIDRAINEWGFRYLKLDFLYAGMFYGKFKNNGASFQWYSRAIDKLTSRKSNNQGQLVTYLGCGLPLELSFKHLPLSRIGCDTLEHWENKLLKKINWNGRNSAYLNLTDTIGHALTNKIIYSNDPDVIFIRNENCSLSKEEKLLIATVNILFGNQIMYSDDPATSCSNDEILLAKEIIEIKNKYSNEEFSIKTLDENLYEIQSKSGKYKGIINLGKEHFINIETIKE